MAIQGLPNTGPVLPVTDRGWEALFLCQVGAVSDPFLVINRRMFSDLIESTPKRLRVQMRNLWIYILLEAEFNGPDRGKLKTGRRELAEETGLSEMTVRSLMRRLKSNQQVTSKVTNKGQLLVVVNYDTWTLSPEESNQQSNQQVTSPCTKTIKQEPKNTHVLEAVQHVVDHFHSRVNGRSRATVGASKKIKTRLKVYSEAELIQAIDNFVDEDPWWMKNNGHRGMAWFFHSDDRIDQFLNLGSQANQAIPASQQELP